MMWKRKKKKNLLILRNEVEARLMEAILKERGIPHLLKSYRDSAYAGLQQPHLGWGHVEASPSVMPEIEAIYRDIAGEDTGREEDGPGGETGEESI
jgi:hypothetical protein